MNDTKHNTGTASEAREALKGFLFGLALLALFALDRAVF